MTSLLLCLLLCLLLLLLVPSLACALPKTSHVVSATAARTQGASDTGRDDSDDDGGADEDAGSADGSVASDGIPVTGRDDVDGDTFFDANESLTARNSRHAAAAAETAARSVRGSSAAPAAPAPAPRKADAPPAKVPSGLPSPGWMATTQPVARRQLLPEPEETQKSVSLWAIIKECIGKDLTRICLPVYFNEPLSALQKMAEEFEYAPLLERAAAAPKGSDERLTWIGVAAVSGCARLHCVLPLRGELTL
jgi:oxysterol-binding protein 1